MKFLLAVHGAPYSSNSQHHALKFAQACVAAGHTIERIFFYHEAVYVALAGVVAPQGETNFTQEWQTFAAANNTELAVCIANGLKRGIVSAGEAARYERPHPSLADKYELVGLGQLIDGMAQADRFVEFPT